VSSRIEFLGERFSARVRRRGSDGGAQTEVREDLPAVGPAHQEDLEAQIDMVRMAVELEGAAEFAGAGTGAREEHGDSFVAHFPELEAQLANWNAAVERLRAAPGELWAWLERAARKRGIEEPPFAVGALIDRLATVTTERSRRGQLRTPHTVRLERSSDRLGGGERLSLHAEGQNVVRVRGDQPAAAERTLAEAGRTIQALFDDAQGSKAAAEVGVARDAMLDLKQPLLETLAEAGAQDPIHVADACPVCRRAAERERDAPAGDAPSET
jgi:hypothetical protein